MRAPVCARLRAPVAALVAAGVMAGAGLTAAGSAGAVSAAGGPTVTYSATQTIPVPPASNYAGSGGGDGWAVALSSTAVYNVFHHSASLTVACHLQSTAAPCWSPETITDGSGHGFATSGHPGLWLDQSTGKLYVYATRDDSTGGVVCIDTTTAATNTDPFCGFTALTAVGDAPDSGISGLSEPAQVGMDWYAFNYDPGSPVAGDKNALLCFDLATQAACPSQPFDVAFGAGDFSAGTYPEPQVSPIGSNVIIAGSDGAGDQISCFDTTTGKTCPGSWPISASGYPSSYGAPYPLLGSDGTLAGFCLPTGTDPCSSLNGTPVATPSGMAAALPATSGWNGQAFVLGPRVYLPNGSTDEVECYDASTNASCANFPKTFANLGLLYTVNADPQRPACVWVNSDDGSEQIQNFDAYTGGACGAGPIRVLASSFVVPTALCTPGSYTSLQVMAPPRNSYGSGTVAFEDGDGNPLPGVPDQALDATGTANLSSLNLSTKIGLPEFLITLVGETGAPGAVTVKLTWTGTYDPSCVRPGTTVTKPGTPEKNGYNWSGYVAQGNFASSPVQASVILPKITCNVKGTVAIWAGYDGYGNANGTVEQDGVNATCLDKGAVPIYYLWYELFKTKLLHVLPYGHVANINIIPVASQIWQHLAPGVRVDMYVNRIPPRRVKGVPLGRDKVYFSLTVDSPAGAQLGKWHRTVTEPLLFSPKYSSSECIVEMPDFRAQPLPEFSTITFQGCSAIDSGSPLTRLYLTSGKDVLDSVGNYTRIAKNVNQFLVHWDASR